LSTPRHSRRPRSTIPVWDSQSILLIVAVVLILLGVFVEAAKFLLWIGLVILLVAIIAWLMRVVKRNA